MRLIHILSQFRIEDIPHKMYAAEWSAKTGGDYTAFPLTPFLNADTNVEASAVLVSTRLRATESSRPSSIEICEEGQRHAKSDVKRDSSEPAVITLIVRINPSSMVKSFGKSTGINRMFCSDFPH
jgi:hypothetical protein